MFDGRDVEDDQVEELKARNRGKYGHRLLVGREFAVMAEVISWWPFINVNGWFPSEWIGGPSWADEWSWLQWCQAMRKKEKKREELQARAAHDEAFRAEYPHLFDHLTALRFEGEDGGSRQVSTLLVFCADDVFKGCLRDREEGLCLWTAGRTFGDMLTVLEGDLCNDTGVWRLDRLAGAVQASRKPKPKSS